MTKVIRALLGLALMTSHAHAQVTKEDQRVTIEYIAHACFRIISPSGKQVLIDPYASRIWLGYDFPSNISADAVLISHPHYDHDGGESKRRAVPWSSNTPVFRQPGTNRVGDIIVEGYRGKHADPWGKEFGQINTIWLLKMGGLRIVHLGDNGPLADETIRALGRVDVLMMPIDSQFHILKADQIAAIRAQLSPAVLIPMHYRHDDLEVSPDKPEQLGGIDEWAKSQSGVKYLASHSQGFSVGTLPREPEVLIFKHSPLVKAPLKAEAGKNMTGAFVGTKAGDDRTVAGLRLCWCPAGRFIMGSPPTEPERRPGEDQVEVTLTKGFWMGKYEVTQADWKRVMGKLPGPPTEELPEEDDLPVGNVNFAEGEAFCDKLTELARRSGELANDWEFRLPTEAQWEYACRAGTTTATSFGDKLSSRQANFKGKPYNGAEPGPSLGRAAKVGSYPANPWGLHDMHGNTFEWCRDWYHSRLPGGVDPDLYSARPTAALNGTRDASRSRRGGCWADDGWPCRSAFRLRFEPERRYDHIGFRVVLVRP